MGVSASTLAGGIRAGLFLMVILFIQTVACAALEAQRRAESEDLDKVGAENEPDSTRFQAEEQKPGNILTDLFLQGLQILNNN